MFFFFHVPATTSIYALSLPHALLLFSLGQFLRGVIELEELCYRLGGILISCPFGKHSSNSYFERASGLSLLQSLQCCINDTPATEIYTLPLHDALPILLHTMHPTVHVLL